jgi:hypothetical protein
MVTKMAERKPKTSPALVASSAPAPAPEREREYTFLGDWCSGDPVLQAAYERQQAIRHPPPPPPLEAHGPPAPQPPGYDGVVNGIWRGEPKLVYVVPKAEPASPKSAMPTRSEMDKYITPDGEIRSRPRGRFDP